MGSGSLEPFIHLLPSLPCVIFSNSESSGAWSDTDNDIAIDDASFENESDQNSVDSINGHNVADIEWNSVLFLLSTSFLQNWPEERFT